MSDFVCLRYSKFSALLHNTGGRTLRAAIDFFCLRGIPDLETFLNNKIHSLFHLWRSRCCCGVPIHTQPMTNEQWNTLYQYQTGRIHSFHSFRGSCPCKYRAVKNISTMSMDVTLLCLIIKNVCPGPLASSCDVDIIREKKNLLISHALSAKMSENDFNAEWNQVKAALCNIAGSISPEFQAEIEKDINSLYDENSSKLAILENTRIQLEQHIQDKTYESTHAVEHGLDMLKQHGIIIYSGFGGSGKTKMAWETMRRYKQEVELAGNNVKTIYLSDLKLWESVVDPTEHSVVLLDDCFGKVSLNRSMIDESTNYFNTMYSCVNRGNVKVLMTVRSNVLADASTKLKGSRLFENIYGSVKIDLSDSAHTLSSVERQSILRKHLVATGVQITMIKNTPGVGEESGTERIDQFTVQKIAEMDHPNFPLLCRLFSSLPKFIRLGLKYFQQPGESLLEHITSKIS